MLIQNAYPFGSAIRISVVFTELGTTNLVDPTDVILSVAQQPNDPQQFTFGNGQVIRDGVGEYHYDFEPPTPGRWLYAWEGIGAVVAGTPNTVFNVLNSLFSE